MNLFRHIFCHTETYENILCELGNLNRKMDNMAATQKDLDDAIAALPEKIRTAVDAAVKPIIDAIIAKGGTTDFQAEVDALGKVGDTVATNVAADITPPAP